MYLILLVEDNDMLSTKNNDYDYTERERQVIELYDQGKSTRDIAKELRMSLRDISIILRKYQVITISLVVKQNTRKNDLL